MSRGEEGDAAAGWPLSHEQIERMRELFAVYAEQKRPPSESGEGGGGGGGEVTAASLRAVLSALGLPVTERHCTEALQRESGASSMNFELFLAFYAAKTRALSAAAELREAFRLLDDDADGRVPASRLVPALARLGGVSEHKALQSVARAFLTPSERKELRKRPEATLERLADRAVTYDEFVRFVEEPLP
jgi:Ca2+-binding EF-hand superfamily protein